MSESGKKKHFKGAIEGELDLVPLIDVVFLILLFFVLCGRLSTDQRTEQISVPPTKTAAKFDTKGWERVVINVYGKTQDGKPPRNSIALPPRPPWVSSGIDDYTGYQQLRTAMNSVYDKAEKYDDPKGTGMRLPKVIVEIRADAETEWRVVQEIQQVLSDTIDPFNNMLPRQVDPKQLRAFVNLDFTTRKPGEK
ncbi:MAG: biopolymer transporter ExbD [Planctomycetota bacterium]|nr:biopolymer transporter ExbD [Planctomycetota bacterium]MCX8039177.1 biopolymer transporter ExbD [Planctomycetota bacterium]MDW8373539.1 biopolymer transporter ExbD [Planctomycetota bacterium]